MSSPECCRLIFIHSSSRRLPLSRPVRVESTSTARTSYAPRLVPAVQILNVMGRLKSGVSIERARVELESIRERRRPTGQRSGAAAPSARRHLRRQACWRCVETSHHFAGSRRAGPANRVRQYGESPAGEGMGAPTRNRNPDGDRRRPRSGPAAVLRREPATRRRGVRRRIAGRTGAYPGQPAAWNRQQRHPTSMGRRWSTECSRNSPMPPTASHW